MIRSHTLVLGLTLVLVLPAVVRAEDARHPTLPSMDQAKDVAVRHLKMEMMGQHAGGMTLRMGTLDDGRLLLTTHVHIEMSRNAGRAETDRFVIDQRQKAHVDAEGRTVASLQEDEEAGVKTTTSAVWGETHVAIVQEGPGGTYETKLEIPEGAASEFHVFRTMCAEYEEGETLHRVFRDLDPSSRVFKEHELWILGRTKIERGGETYDAWKIRQKSDGMTAEALVSDDFLPYEMSLMGGVMKATWADEAPFEVEGAGWSVDIMVAVDRAVPRQFELEELELRYVIDPMPPADEDAMFEDNAFQTVTREEDGYRLVLHAGRPPKGYEAPALPIEPEDEAIARFLEPTPQSQSDHPAIVERAAELVAGAKNGLLATARIVRWVWANVAKKSGAQSGATAFEVLECREGDCTEHAVLTAALARAAGIPARSVGGVVYLVTPKGEAMAGYHAWNEVWLGRWIPVDATIPEVGTSARYMRMHISEPGQEDTSAAGMVRALSGKTRIEIVAWKHFGGERVEAAEAVTAEAE